MRDLYNVRRNLALFWVSCMALFFEILLIRWLSAEIRIFSYFHNLVLLFCFLGIGLGCARAKQEANLSRSFMVMGLLVLLVKVDFGMFSFHQISNYLSMGTNFLIWAGFAAARWEAALGALIIGIGLLLCCMFFLATFFIPFGQLLGRLFDESQHPLRAYGTNVFGSLVGVWLFGAISAHSLPPTVWFVVGGIGCLPFVKKRREVLLAVLLLIGIGGVLVDKRTPNEWTVWSPYQKLTVLPLQVKIENQPVIDDGYTVLVNSVGYMLMNNYSSEFFQQHPSLYPKQELPYDHYNIPYRFADRLDDVLVVGAGAGNDAAGALRNGAARVTAVDIDPVVIHFGSQLHPEAPYQDSRVTVVIDDARSFFKKTSHQYDLIIFGLLDSHTLSSSYSNVRLDNYVYTVESFREAKRLLKPHGVLVVSFYVVDNFIGARLQKMLTEVFGQRPIGLLARLGLTGAVRPNFVTGDQPLIHKKLSEDARLRGIVEQSRPLFDNWASLAVDMTTDNWPYFYLEHKTIPILYFIIFGLLFVVSYLGIKKVVGPTRRMQWPFFFLGAGFLLLEVQSISKSALLFGATWMVNTLVISAVLVMVLLANYIVMRWPPVSLTPDYLALFVALASNAIVPLDVFSHMPILIKGLLATAFLSLPIFFAGIIFSASFSKTGDRAGAVASNLIGAMVGGMTECLSFITGIKALLIVAAIFYVCSIIRKQKSPSLSVS